jgi:hypothetical protein
MDVGVEFGGVYGLIPGFSILKKQKGRFTHAPDKPPFWKS